MRTDAAVVQKEGRRDGKSGMENLPNQAQNVCYCLPKSEFFPSTYCRTEEKTGNGGF